jgi:flavin reductase (DIM6/NTAB) family NADH-FMN oxidoreductase RutF
VPIDPELFKQVFASWPSGVTIVTSRDGERSQGMTVSAFTEVSLEPPLVLVCADKSTITNELIQASRAFSVSILAEDQQALSNKFASKKDEQRRFEGLDCALGATGCARIPGALAWMDCEVVQAVDAGDHYVYIGEIKAADVNDQGPLLHFRSSYGKFS